MAKIKLLPTIAAALLTPGLIVALAQAQTNRTWVSGQGADSGACGITAPCKTFAYAQTQTAVPGEIDVLDPGDFGRMNITSSLSLVNDGAGVAAIGVSSGNAITITAGPSDSVHLRGLTITGIGGGSNGIDFASGGDLSVENCVVRYFAGAGISVSPSTSSSFTVLNTIASNNNSGILVQPTGAAAVSGVFSNTTAYANASGIIVNGALMTGTTLNVTIVDSEASSNGTSGVLAGSVAGGAAVGVMLRNVVASYNGGGLVAQTNATLFVAQSVITGNITGVSPVGGGIINSYGDNDIEGNTTDGGLTTIATH